MSSTARDPIPRFHSVSSPNREWSVTSAESWPQPSLDPLDRALDYLPPYYICTRLRGCVQFAHYIRHEGSKEATCAKLTEIADSPCIKFFRVIRSVYVNLSPILSQGMWRIRHTLVSHAWPDAHSPDFLLRIRRCLADCNRYYSSSVIVLMLREYSGEREVTLVSFLI